MHLPAWALQENPRCSSS